MASALLFKHRIREWRFFGNRGASGADPEAKDDCFLRVPVKRDSFDALWLEEETMTLGISERRLTREIRREQRETDELLASIHSMFHERGVSGTTAANRVIDALEELREHLGMVFALKETNGYVDDFVVAAPPLCPRAQVLKEQHEELFRALGLLIDQADGDLEQHRWRDLWKIAEMTFENFCDRLREHQAGEARLVQQAFLEDVGIGD